MRGLTRADYSKAGTAVAGAAAVGLVLGGCAAGAAGVRTEGPATESPSEPAPLTSRSPVPASESPQPDVNAVGLVKKDPKVSETVRKRLKPCKSGGDYPVDVSYGNLTGGSSDDIVVNVLTCSDAIGIGTYVYRREAGSKRYEAVFTNEQPPVYAEVTKGDLVVTRQVYGPGDEVNAPSGEDVIVYHWNSEKFVAIDRNHNDYSNAVDGADPTDAPEEG
ncbi:hypothetical protein [Streptomyces sp. NPDC047108]|uniref:hypothetical protein n=1 Tax=Streptomyces sp. NPDC047108 TaxID=3155025 RepID=UPI0033F40F16